MRTFLRKRDKAFQQRPHWQLLGAHKLKIRRDGYKYADSGDAK
jgi:hypothetical protein